MSDWLLISFLAQSILIIMLSVKINKIEKNYEKLRKVIGVSQRSIIHSLEHNRVNSKFIITIAKHVGVYSGRDNGPKKGMKRSLRLVKAMNELDDEKK